MAALKQNLQVGTAATLIFGRPSHKKSAALCGNESLSGQLGHFLVSWSVATKKTAPPLKSASGGGNTKGRAAVVAVAARARILAGSMRLPVVNTASDA